MIMRVLILFLSLFFVAGCSSRSIGVENALADISTVPTKKDDSASCAYWKCSQEKKLYMQKYVKSDGSSYRPAGTYRLDQGVGAFPLSELDKYKSDGEQVSLDRGFDPCPYCNSHALGKCTCGKTLCIPDNSGRSSCSGISASVTCPWCERKCFFSASGSWGVGGGG